MEPSQRREMPTEESNDSSTLDPETEGEVYTMRLMSTYLLLHARERFVSRGVSFQILICDFRLFNFGISESYFLNFTFGACVR